MEPNVVFGCRLNCRSERCEIVNRMFSVGYFDWRVININLFLFHFRFVGIFFQRQAALGTTLRVGDVECWLIGWRKHGVWQL